MRYRDSFAARLIGGKSKVTALTLPISLPQTFAFGILIIMMGMFVWGRLRYDLVAMLALLAGIATGIVPFDKAFSGFSDDIVIIVASALVVSTAVARSGVIERIIRPISPYLSRTAAQVSALAGAVMLLSGIMKNIGALAMMMPVAFQLSRRHDKPVSRLLMPMSFAALLGGIVTLVGTSPNIIVSRVRQELTGQPFGMFDFAPVGAGIAIVGLVFLVFGYRLLPSGRKGASSIDAAFNLEGYTTEVLLPEGASLVGKTSGDLKALGEGELKILVLLRGGTRRHGPADDLRLEAGDILLLEGEPEVLQRVVSEAGLTLSPDEASQNVDAPDDDIGVMEAVVSSDSILVDRTAAQMNISHRYQVNLLAIGRRGEQISEKISSVPFKAGDVIILRGNLNTLAETLGELRCLPLAARDMRLGEARFSLLPITALLVAMALISANLLPVQIGFFWRCRRHAAYSRGDAARSL